MNDEDFAAWSPGEAMLEDRSGLSFDWLTIEDDGESFAALRELSQAGKQALFAACVARTVKGQLAFEPQARPELEATVARLDIDFAKHVRPTADMLWSRIAKGRILEIARSVLSPAWASARSKNKKPDLAKAMEQAFAAGDPPLGLSAEMHAAALAWVPPGFAAFDTGRVHGEADDAAEAAPEQVADASGPEPVAEAEAARAASNAEGDGNGDSTPEPGAAAADDGNDAGDDDRIAATAGTAIPEDAPGATDGMPPAHINGRDAAPDPLEIPEFLRRVH